MKTTELRVGNYINDEQTTHIVAGIVADVVHSYWLKDTCKKDLYQTPISLIKPIIITDEWLLKFGFLKTSYGEDCFSKGDILIDLNDFNCVLKSRWLDIEVKYIHNLQNFYYALTARELIMTTN